MGAHMTKFGTDPKFIRVMEFSYYLFANVQVDIRRSEFAHLYTSVVRTLLTELKIEHSIDTNKGVINVGVWNMYICTTWLSLRPSDDHKFDTTSRMGFLIDLYSRSEARRTIAAEIAALLPQPIAEEICEYIYIARLV